MLEPQLTRLPGKADMEQGKYNSSKHALQFAQDERDSLKAQLRKDDPLVDKYRTVNQSRLEMINSWDTEPLRTWDTLLTLFRKAKPGSAPTRVPQEIYDQINDVHYGKVSKKVFDPKKKSGKDFGAQYLYR